MYPLSTYFLHHYSQSLLLLPAAHVNKKNIDKLALRTYIYLFLSFLLHETHFFLHRSFQMTCYHVITIFLCSVRLHVPSYFALLAPSFLLFTVVVDWKPKFLRDRNIWIGFCCGPIARCREHAGARNGEIIEKYIQFFNIFVLFQYWFSAYLHFAETNREKKNVCVSSCDDVCCEQHVDSAEQIWPV